jgi:hypothetical protein
MRYVRRIDEVIAGGSFTAFSSQSGTSIRLRLPAIFETAAHERLQLNRI